MQYSPRMTRLSCGFLGFALLIGCGDRAPNASGAEASPAQAVDVASGPALELGDWTTYPDPSSEELPAEATEPLDDDRWARVSAELACAGRVVRGDPGAHRLASRRVLQFHKTTGKAVMEYGVEVNLDAGKAARLGSLVAAAAERCR